MYSNMFMGIIDKNKENIITNAMPSNLHFYT